MKKYTLLIFSGILLAFAFVFMYSQGFAAVNIPGGTKLSEVSIDGDIADGSVDTKAVKNLGFQLLNFARIAISGLALIYIVLMGAYMVMFSDNEGEMTKQRRQLIYVLVGFLFLNLPGLVYDVLVGTGGTGTKTIQNSTAWTDISMTNGVFWNISGLSGIMTGLINFLRVFVYGVAIAVLSWGALSLIFGSHQDDARKKAQTRFTYGILGIIFMGFVDIWATMVSRSDLSSAIKETGSSLIGIAVYFAAPIAVFFLIVGAYFYITSAGDENRAKRGRNIVINTLIAAIILIASFSFLTELTSIF